MKFLTYLTRLSIRQVQSESLTNAPLLGELREQMAQTINDTISNHDGNCSIHFSCKQFPEDKWDTHRLQHSTLTNYYTLSEKQPLQCNCPWNNHTVLVLPTFK